MCLWGSVKFSRERCRRKKKRAQKAAFVKTICQPAVKTSTINKGVIRDGYVGRLAGETGGRNGRVYR